MNINTRQTPSYLLSMINEWTGDEFFNTSRQVDPQEHAEDEPLQQDDFIDDTGYQYKKSLKYGSEEARHLSREYVIEEICRCHAPPDSRFDEILKIILPQVKTASIELKLQSDNPVKLFAYMFLLKTGLPSKQVLSILRLSFTKTGNQFSIISKGRHIYQRYMARIKSIIPQDLLESDCLQKQIVDELALLHKDTGIFRGHTRDVLCNIALVLTRQVPAKNKKIRDLVQAVIAFSETPASSKYFLLTRQYINSFKTSNCPLSSPIQKKPHSK